MSPRQPSDRAVGRSQALDDSANVAGHLALYVRTVCQANIIHRHWSGVVKVSDVASGSPLPGLMPAPSKSIFRS
jgi:hypothetical protein